MFSPGTRSEEVSYLAQVQFKEDRLKSIFSPLEKYICLLESVLTWEYPIVFILLIALFNFLFWIYSITPFYCLISIGGFTALSIQFLVNHVFPLVTDVEASDEWVKVRANSDNLDLLHCLAIAVTRFENLYKLLEFHKRDNRDRFNLLGILACTLLFLSSYIINESHLVYFLVMASLFWPGLKYNRVTDRAYKMVKPYVDHFEQKMRIKRRVSIKGRGSGDEEDSDAELQQFIPAKEIDESFPSIAIDDGDDSDTTEDFMPHVTGRDSGEGSDDELLSEDLALTLQNKNSYLHKDENVEISSSDSETGDIRLCDTSPHIVEFVEENTPITDMTPEIEEHFTEGLSFDDDDDVNCDVDGSAKDKSLLKEFGQAHSSGVIEKTFTKLASFYKTVSSYVPSSAFLLMKNKEDIDDSQNDAQVVDDEFDFLNQELEDLND